jgi:methyl-accepting chemotaxis protein
MATKNKIEDEIDELFKLPLTEFTVARNALAARLKKAGNRDEAERVKALSKPTLSAWAVNQLYWTHGDAFKELIAAGKRFGKADDMREVLNARREAISALTRHAADLLRDAGHNPTPDIIRRITTTLEALSASSSVSDPPIPGRLTADVDPPGFESLAALMPSVGRPARPDESTRVVPFQSSSAALEAAEEALREAQTIASHAAAALEKATDHANEVEKQRQDAEERFRRTTAAAEEARRQMHNLTDEAKKAAEALESAERWVEKARKKISMGRR